MSDTRINDGPGRNEADRLFMAELGTLDPQKAVEGRVGEEVESDGVSGTSTANGPRSRSAAEWTAATTATSSATGHSTSSSATSRPGSRQPGDDPASPKLP